jgi:hypothetical protein
MSDRSIHISVGISTDTRVEGDLYVGVFDGNNGRQLQVRVLDRPDVDRFIEQVKREAAAQDIEITVDDKAAEYYAKVGKK